METEIVSNNIDYILNVEANIHIIYISIPINYMRTQRYDMSKYI